jgi:hypothetical protein
MIMRGTLPDQVPHSPVFIITLSDEELLRLETHTTPAVYRWGLLSQKLATVAKATSSANILWPLDNLTPNIYCEKKFTLCLPEFKGSAFEYVSHWVDETTDAQAEGICSAWSDMIDDDVVAEKIQYLGSFEHSFNPWDSVALCHVDDKTLQDRRDHSGCVLEHVCGSCGRCAEFIRLYGEHYGAPVVDDRPTPGLFTTPLAVVPRIL